MLVKHILRDKGRNVVTTTAAVTLQDAVRVLSQNRIGALVVLEEGGALTGIISERDIVHALAQDGVSSLGHPVGMHMTRDVEICTETATVEDLMEIMTHRRLRHLPVVEAGELRGIVSIGDVVKTRIAETMREAENLREYIGAG